jgi:hypothetical protein
LNEIYSLSDACAGLPALLPAANSRLVDLVDEHHRFATM